MIYDRHTICACSLAILATSFAGQAALAQNRSLDASEGPSLGPALQPEPNTETSIAQVRHALRPARTALARALATKNPKQRQTMLRAAANQASRLLKGHKNEPLIAIDLMGIQARINVALDDLAGARRVMKLQHKEYKAKFGDERFSSWLSERVNRLSARGLWTLAQMQLESAIEAAPSEEVAGMLDLRIGDLMIPQGDFERAKRHYLGVATRRPAIWPQAYMRAGRIALQARNLVEAKTLFQRVVREGNGTPEAEDARHVLKVLAEDRK